MIAYLVHRFPVGTQTFTYDELRVFADAGLDVVVYSFRPGEQLGWPLEGIELRILPAPSSAAYLRALVVWALFQPGRFARAVRLVLAGRYLERPSLRERLANLMGLPRGALLARERGVELFHAQFANEAATAALVASELSGVPFSFRSHTAPNPQLLGEKLRRAAVVLSISDYDAAQLRAVEPRARIVVAPLGIPLPELDDVERDPALVVSVGSLIEKKGHDVLIEACRRLVAGGRIVRCEIVGDGELREALTRRVEAAGLDGHVTLRGYLPRHEVERLVARAGVFVLASVPSRIGVDGVPVVLIEAMALGTPCVSTSLSGIPELVRDGETGLLVAPGDAAALVAAIEALLEDSARARRFGEAGRAFVRSTRDAESCYSAAAAELSAVTAASRSRS